MSEDRDGWVLVPRTATKAMLDAAYAAYDAYEAAETGGWGGLGSVYSAMIASASSPDQSGVGGDLTGYAEYTPVTVRCTMGEPASPSGSHPSDQAASHPDLAGFDPSRSAAVTVEQLAEMDALSDAASPGIWSIWPERIDNAAAAARELADQCARTNPVGDHLYLLNAEGKCPGSTGCGPLSEANAKFITALINGYRSGHLRPCVSDEHPTGEDAIAAEGEACQRGPEGEAPQVNPKSPSPPSHPHPKTEARKVLEGLDRRKTPAMHILALRKASQRCLLVENADKLLAKADAIESALLTLQSDRGDLE